MQSMTPMRKPADPVRASSTVDLTVPLLAVREWVRDLSRYPRWMPLVHSAVADTGADGADAWTVELRAKVGVFARSKRLRMVRTVDAENRLVFERHERDGRAHSPWTLEVTLVDAGPGCSVTMEMHYGGSLWTAGVLDRVLAHHIDQGKKGLAEVAET